MSNSMKGFERSGTTPAIKRDLGGKLSMSAIGLIPPSASSGHIHQSKRSKPMSDTSCFDDLPEDVFAEILCRLPCHILLVRCKRVSKRWNRFVSFLICDSNFISRFIRLKHDSKTPIIRALLNSKGNEFRVTKVTSMKMKAEELITAVTMGVKNSLTSMEGSAGDEALITTEDFAAIMAKTVEQSLCVISSKPLTPLFKSLVSFYGLKKEPVVMLATYNDLVLCQHGKHDYNICNPYTKQVVALPRASPSDEFQWGVVVGFICHLDKCRVVRIPRKLRLHSSNLLKVEIFSSETGVWRWSVISFIQPISPGLTTNITYFYNGMLHWETSKNTFIGFDPFMINSSSSSSSDVMDHYKGRIIEFGDNKSEKVECVGMCGGRLRFIGNLDLVSYELPVWELGEEHDQDRCGKMLLKCTWYSLDREMFRDRSWGNWRVFDPNDEDTLYVHCSSSSSRQIYRCNIRTRKWSKLPYPSGGRGYFFQLTLVPWWPTPVPKIFKRTYSKSKKQNYKEILIEQQVQRYIY